MHFGDAAGKLDMNNLVARQETFSLDVIITPGFIYKEEVSKHS